MTKKIILSFLSWLLMVPLWAANTVTTVEQVTEEVTLTEAVDYHITSTTPFSLTGKINLENENAVVIFDNLKPSQAGPWLSYIRKGGVSLQSGATCQVRIFDCGSLILPFGESVKPLTVYADRNFEGSYTDNFDLSNSGGYMNTLSSAQMNNGFKSFRLKRGYMVTFSLKSGGYGYSRCFIADLADLEMNLPLIMQGRVSSYRIFKWQNISKRGYAGTDPTVNGLLNTTWFYGWNADGGNQYPDREYVPQHHHEGWPSIEDVGRNGTSAHALGNNEPDNTGDDREQVNTVDQVLANWEKMMATGKRLGSPAMSGNKTWISQFFDSIDARGWRCEFIAVHDYNLNDRGSKIWNVNDYKSCANGRPVWLTEMNYGANWTSWPGSNTNGNAANYKIELDHFGPTIDGYNETDYVERYAFYNWVQDCRMVYNSGDASLADKNYLTPMGEYYAAVHPGLAYNAAYDIAPKNPRTYKPEITSTNFTAAQMKFTLKFSCYNGDLADSIVVERKDGTNGNWKGVKTFPLSESNTNLSYGDVVENAGTYTYRIAEHMFNGTVKYSEEVYNVIEGADGTADLQYGTLSASSTDNIYAFMKESYTENPAIITGGTTNKNTSFAPVENIVSISRSGYFTFKYFPWTLSTSTTFTKAETTSYLIAQTGRGTIGTLNYEAGPIVNASNRPQRINSDTTEVTFKQPFETIPVVMVSPYGNSLSYPVTARVFDITTEGFKVKLQRQEGIESNTKPNANCSYLAIEQGQTSNGVGKLITVDTTTVRITRPNSPTPINYNSETELTNPIFLIQQQTLNHNLQVILRIVSTGSKQASIRIQPDDTATGRIFNTNKPYSERMGYIVVSDDPNYTNAIGTIAVNGKVQGKLVVYGDPEANALGVKDPEATEVTVYSAGGQKLLSQPLTEGRATLNLSTLPSGVYIVRSNANHTTKIVRR